MISPSLVIFLSVILVVIHQQDVVALTGDLYGAPVGLDPADVDLGALAVLVEVARIQAGADGVLDGDGVAGLDGEHHVEIAREQNDLEVVAYRGLPCCLLETGVFLEVEQVVDGTVDQVVAERFTHFSSSSLLSLASAASSAYFSAAFSASSAYFSAAFSASSAGLTTTFSGSPSAL